MEYVFGLTVGLAVGIGVVVLLFRKKVLDMTFDERQERARGKAFQYGFFTLAGCIVAYGLLDSAGFRWCDTLTGCIICLCMGLTVFAVTCILNDAYLSLKEQPGKVVTALVVTAFVNLAIGAVYLIHGKLVEDGILTIRSVNLICGIMVLVVLVVYAVTRLLARREESE